MMKLIGEKRYPGRLKYSFYTLKQMKEFLRRSEGITKDYWAARIKATYGEDA